MILFSFHIRRYQQKYHLIQHRCLYLNSTNRSILRRKHHQKSCHQLSTIRTVMMQHH